MDLLPFLVHDVLSTDIQLLFRTSDLVLTNMTKINNFGQMGIKSFIDTNRLIAKIIFFITRIILKIKKKKKKIAE